MSRIYCIYALAYPIEIEIGGCPSRAVLRFIRIVKDFGESSEGAALLLFINFKFITAMPKSDELKKPELMPDTFLTDRNICMLKRMFKDEDTYIMYLETLWGLRDLAEKACMIQTEHGLSQDVNHPLFRVFILANEFIGALHDGRINFEVVNGKVHKF